jgi:hypothetical protein
MTLPPASSLRGAQRRVVFVSNRSPVSSRKLTCAFGARRCKERSDGLFSLVVNVLHSQVNELPPLPYPQGLVVARSAATRQSPNYEVIIPEYKSITSAHLQHDRTYSAFILTCSAFLNAKKRGTNGQVLNLRNKDKKRGQTCPLPL